MKRSLADSIDIIVDFVGASSSHVLYQDNPLETETEFENLLRGESRWQKFSF